MNGNNGIIFLLYKHLTKQFERYILTIKINVPPSSINKIIK